MRSQLRIGSGLCWATAWLLVLAAFLGSLLWPSALMWWISLALVLPLVGLAAWRQESKGGTDETYGIVDGGPWGPPPGA
jgi:FtsH-binding integral membrane protein